MQMMPHDWFHLISSSGMHPGSERAEAAQTMLCTDHDPQKILPSGVRLDGDTAGVANLWPSC